MELRKTKLFQRENEILWYFPQIFSNYHLDDFAGLPWQQNSIFVFGKEYLEPRLTCYFGPKYKYSSIEWPVREMPIELHRIQSILSSITGFNGNAVLCNFYRNGADSMGWHSDNEREIDQRSIASISFGASRKMEFRNKKDKGRISVELHHGDLLLMENFQESWQHAIFKKKESKPRINLTFRQIMSV